MAGRDVGLPNASTAGTSGRGPIFIRSIALPICESSDGDVV